MPHPAGQLFPGGKKCPYLFSTRNVIEYAGFGPIGHNDIDALSAIQKAVNKANCKNIGCNVMYTIHQKEGIVRVHSRSQLLFLPDIRYLDLYLTEKLQELLKVRHDVVIAIRTEIAMQ